MLDSLTIKGFIIAALSGAIGAVLFLCSMMALLYFLGG